MDPYGPIERRREQKREEGSETVKAGANISFSFFLIIVSSGGNEHEVVMGLLGATRYAIGAMASHT